MLISSCKPITFHWLFWSCLLNLVWLIIARVYTLITLFDAIFNPLRPELLHKIYKKAAESYRNIQPWVSLDHKYLHTYGFVSSALTVCIIIINYTSGICLQQTGRLADLHVLFLVDPALDVLLYHDTAGSELVTSQFLQVRHLSGTEKYFSLTKLVFICVL